MSSYVSIAGDEWSANQFEVPQQPSESLNNYAVVIENKLHVVSRGKQYFCSEVTGSGVLPVSESEQLLKLI